MDLTLIPIGSRFGIYIYIFIKLSIHVGFHSQSSLKNSPTDVRRIQRKDLPGDSVGSELEATNLDLPKGAEWMIRGAYTQSFRIEQHPLEDAGSDLFIYVYIVIFNLIIQIVLNK